MSGDHLDKETSISAEITEKGIKAGAKSRFIASIDRLAGGIVDLASAHVEAPAQRRRAQTEGEVDLIKAAAQYGVERLGADPAQAERAFQKHFAKVVKHQDNSEGVLREALEDLSANPPNEASAADETPLSEEFLDRLEGYSATASTDELRKRWGRVLAAEVRKPGSFSGKVLRVVDELESEDALLFEEVAKHRIGRILPKALIGDLDFDRQTRLVLAGLLIEPGITGQVRWFETIEDKAGRGLQLVSFPSIGAVSYPHSDGLHSDERPMPALAEGDDKVGLPCYILSDVGVALASILADDQFDAMLRYARTLARHNHVSWVRVYAEIGNNYSMIEEIPGVKVQGASA